MELHKQQTLTHQQQGGEQRLKNQHISKVVLLTLLLSAIATTPAAAQIHADLRADTNYDGIIDTQAESDEQREEQQSAIYLPNIDDDSSRCRTKAQQQFRRNPALLNATRQNKNQHVGGEEIDKGLMRCNDASDRKINGLKDLQDLSRIEILPLNVNKNQKVRATITLDTKSCQHVRTFQADLRLAPQCKPLVLSQKAARNGTHLFIEGKDVSYTQPHWDGNVTVSLHVQTMDKESATDRLSLRQSPILIQNDLQRTEALFFQSPTNTVLKTLFEPFINGITKTTSQTTKNLQQPNIPGLREDWPQDLFESGWATKPQANNQTQAMRVVLRSANYFRKETWGKQKLPARLRESSRALYGYLQGPDTAVFQLPYTKQRSGIVDDSLNSGGNIEVLPPIADDHYANGTVVVGSSPQRQPDTAFMRFLRQNRSQPVITVNTSWLEVGHVDEFLHVLPQPDGWALAIPDPVGMWNKLKELDQSGFGQAKMRVNPPPGEFDLKHPWQELSVRELLENHALENEQREAETHIAQALNQLQSQLPVHSVKIVRLPVLFHREQNPENPKEKKQFQAFTPNLVNGITLSGKDLVLPEPHGPIANNENFIKGYVEKQFFSTGLQIHWVDTWSSLHIAGGEAHCGSNVLRAKPELDWWL